MLIYARSPVAKHHTLGDLKGEFIVLLFWRLELKMSVSRVAVSEGCEGRLFHVSGIDSGGLLVIMVFLGFSKASL